MNQLEQSYEHQLRMIQNVNDQKDSLNAQFLSIDGIKNVLEPFFQKLYRLQNINIKKVLKEKNKKSIEKQSISLFLQQEQEYKTKIEASIQQYEALIDTAKKYKEQCDHCTNKFDFDYVLVKKKKEELEKKKSSVSEQLNELKCIEQNVQHQYGKMKFMKS